MTNLVQQMWRREMGTKGLLLHLLLKMTMTMEDYHALQPTVQLDGMRMPPTPMKKGMLHHLHHLPLHH